MSKGSKRRPGKVSQSNWDKAFGPKHETYELCRGCYENDEIVEVEGLAPDGIAYCPECEHIVEGNTITKEVLDHD